MAASRGNGMGGFMRRPGEYTNVSENSGGLISQFLLILAQTAGLILLLALAIAIVLIALWSLPAELWWGILTNIYALVILGMGFIFYVGFEITYKKATWSFEGIGPRLDTWGKIGYAVGFSLIIAAAAWVFDQWIWDPLDAWTQDFFCVRVPTPNGWMLAAATFTVISLLLLAAKKLWTGGTLALWIASILTSLGLWLLALVTAKWERPGPHFYLFAGPLAGAIVCALVQGAIRMKNDLYWPMWGSVPIPEEEEEQFAANNYILVDAPSRSVPLKDPGSLTEVTGPKGERWLISETNLIEVIRLIPVKGLSQRAWMGWKPPAGLVMYNQDGKQIRKNETWTQWAHWAPYWHFLKTMGIHNGKKVDTMFLDAKDQPDAESILAYLKLNGYAEEEIDG